MSLTTDAACALARSLTRSENLELRPVASADLPLLTEAWDDPGLLILQDGHVTPRSWEDRQAAQANWYSNTQDGSFGLGFALRSTGQLIGAFTCYGITSSSLAATFAIHLLPDYLSQGLGKEAVKLAVDYSFSSRPLHRLGLGVYAYNNRAIRCYEKAGFAVEGRRREMVYLDGSWHDVILMGILRSDWESGRN